MSIIHIYKENLHAELGKYHIELDRIMRFSRLQENFHKDNNY